MSGKSTKEATLAEEKELGIEAEVLRTQAYAEGGLIFGPNKEKMARAAELEELRDRYRKQREDRDLTIRIEDQSGRPLGRAQTRPSAINAADDD